MHAVNSAKPRAMGQSWRSHGGPEQGKALLLDTFLCIQPQLLREFGITSVLQDKRSGAHLSSMVISEPYPVPCPGHGLGEAPARAVSLVPPLSKSLTPLFVVCLCPCRGFPEDCT